MTYSDPLHMSYEELTVYYNEQPQFILNKRLMDKQLAWDNLEEIKETHWLKLMIYDIIRETNDTTLMKSLAEDLTLIESHLQELWKFPVDEKFHRFWETPKCICPKLDNEDSYATGYCTVTLSCPLHGKE